MTLQAGDTVWIPCEVTRSVFPDERNISIESITGAWIGFVDVRHLREGVLSGRTAVRATIVAASNEEFSARLPGQTGQRDYPTFRAPLLS